MNFFANLSLAPPFVASTPHFFNGEPLLSQAFKLAPKRDKDATFVDIEPVCIFYYPFFVCEKIRAFKLALL